MSNEQFSTGAQRGAQDDKPRLDLIDPPFELAIAEVLRVGAKPPPEGYGEDNWRKGMPYSRLYASMRRHLLDWYLGEEDEDHLAHLACNAMFAMNYGPRVKSGNLPAFLDDRPPDYGYMPELDYPRDIALERLVPREGTWDWAVLQMKAGKLLHRVLWITKSGYSTTLRYKWDILQGMVLGTIDNVDGWSSDYIDDIDKEATDWEIFLREGTSEWALDQMKEGKVVRYRFLNGGRLSECQYLLVEGKMFGDNVGRFSPNNGPGCHGDRFTTDPGGKWEVCSAKGTSEWALDQMQQGKKVIPIHQEWRGSCEYYLRGGKVVFGNNGDILTASNGPGCKNDDTKKLSFVRWEVV